MSNAESHTSSATSLLVSASFCNSIDVDDASANSPIPQSSINPHLSEQPFFDSLGFISSEGRLTGVLRPSAPLITAYHANSHILSMESSGFSDNPVCPLNSAAPACFISSPNSITMEEAPIFATNPACIVNYPGDKFSLICDTVTALTGNSITNLAYPPIHMVQTPPLFYNAFSTEAPSFLPSLAYPLN